MGDAFLLILIIVLSIAFVVLAYGIYKCVGDNDDDEMEAFMKEAEEWKRNKDGKFGGLDNKKRCETCRHGDYDRIQGYVCVNGKSEHVADFVRHDHSCENYEKKE